MADHLALLPCDEAVNFDAAFGIHKHTSVDDRGDGKAQCQPCTVASGVLLGIVEFMRHIAGIVCVQNGRLVATVPGLALHQPDNSIACAVGGNHGVGAGVGEALCAPLHCFDIQLPCLQGEIV